VYDEFTARFIFKLHVIVYKLRCTICYDLDNELLHIKSEISPRRVHMGMHFSEFLGVSLAFTTTLVLPLHLSATLIYDRLDRLPFYHNL
jgi:hypothetical protein